MQLSCARPGTFQGRRCRDVRDGLALAFVDNHRQLFICSGVGGRRGANDKVSHVLVAVRRHNDVLDVLVRTSQVTICPVASPVITVMPSCATYLPARRTSAHIGAQTGRVRTSACGIFRCDATHKVLIMASWAVTTGSPPFLRSKRQSDLRVVPQKKTWGPVNRPTRPPCTCSCERTVHVRDASVRSVTYWRG